MIPTLVLTRPQAQSRQTAAALPGSVPVVIAPVLSIAATGLFPDLAGYRGVILTSANAVAFAPALNGQTAWCVGERTAQAAGAAGASVALAARDADDLVARIAAPGPLLHLRGEHARGDVTKRLGAKGIETDEATIYRQQEMPLSPKALALLRGAQPVVLPLFSPRSARLIAAQAGTIGAAVHAIAMSPAVAQAWAGATGRAAETCAAPTGAEMLGRIRAACGVESP